MSIKTMVGTLAVAASLWAVPSMAKDCNTSADKQECCSAKDCGGKVLSNRDAHNCKDKSKGKSWHAKAPEGGAATCQNM